MKKFWAVVSDDRRLLQGEPLRHYVFSHRHPSLERAKAEAARLAVMNPGTSFMVLELIGSSIKPSPQAQWSEAEPAEDESLPF